jgi:D-glycero-alpha-D-manno-heptose-7-phosphate kinase
MKEAKIVITQTPLRLSFFGGSSDIESFYLKNNGCVISSTIDKYIYVTLKSPGNLFDEKYRLNYQQAENLDNVKDIKNNIIRECLNFFKIEDPLYISTVADIPSQSGLGSSSSFTVGLLNALYSYTGKKVSAGKLAEEACHIEIEVIKSPIGKQDQYAAAFGGLNKFDFSSSGVQSQSLDMMINPIDVFKNFQLFWTGVKRSADDILNSISFTNPNNVENIKSIVKDCENVFEKIKQKEINNFENLGKIFDKSWQSKKMLSTKISNKSIDDAYTLAKNRGSLGGKIAGAGGGGFLLLITPINKQKQVMDSLVNFTEVPIKYEPHGSRVIISS